MVVSKWHFVVRSMMQYTVGTRSEAVVIGTNPNTKPKRHFRVGVIVEFFITVFSRPEYLFFKGSLSLLMYPDIMRPIQWSD